MAWQYEDWITLTAPAARLTRLRLHIQEVAPTISASVSADGKSRDAHTNLEYYKILREEEKSLTNTVGSGVAGNRTLGRPMRAR